VCQLTAVAAGSERETKKWRQPKRERARERERERESLVVCVCILSNQYGRERERERGWERGGIGGRWKKEERSTEEPAGAHTSIYRERREIYEVVQVGGIVGGGRRRRV
jgi:hypothetical protein